MDLDAEDRRIRAHYKAAKISVFRWNKNGTMSDVWMRLARRWKRPVREIKNIVHYHGRTDWM